MKQYSTTQVLGPFYDFSGIDPEVLAAAAERGTDVHNACACFAQDLPVLRMNRDVVGYFDSFMFWFISYVDQVYFVEKRFYHSVYGYHGKIDLGCKLVDGRNMIVDYKTPATEGPTWKAQLASYLELANNNPGPVFDGCMSLLLRKNGKAAKGIVYQDSPDDFAAFLSALNAFRYFKK